MQTVESEPSRVVQAETETCMRCRSEKRTEEIEIDMNQYDALRCRYEGLLADYEKIMNENSALKIELRKLPVHLPHELREKNALLRKENEELRNQILHMKTDEESPRQRGTSVEDVNPQSRSQVAPAQNCKDEGANISKDLVDQPKPGRIGPKQLRRKSRGNPIEEIIHNAQIYLDPTIGGQAKENNLLASQIASTTNPNPKYAEADYSHQFNQINDEIETWVVKHVNSIAPGTLSQVYRKEQNKYAKLVSQVKVLDENAGKDLETQKAELFANPENRRNYIALMRHVIALFLQSQIFRLFVFGLDRKDLADSLNRLENELCTNGLLHLDNKINHRFRNIHYRESSSMGWCRGDEM